MAYEWSKTAHASHVELCEHLFTIFLQLSIHRIISSSKTLEELATDEGFHLDIKPACPGIDLVKLVSHFIV